MESDTSDSGGSENKVSPPPPPPGQTTGPSPAIVQAVAKGKELYESRHNGGQNIGTLAEYFNANYKTKVSQDSDIPASLGFKGAFVKVVTWHNATKQPEGNQYRTFIDPISGVIVIDHIQRDDSEEKLTDGRFFPCSEILYQQLKMVQSPQPPRLTQITQAGVTGGGSGTLSSQQIIYAFYDKSTPSADFQPGQGGFYALLSTINGKNAIYLIKDHGNELRIGSVERAIAFTKKSEGTSGAGKLCFSLFFSDHA